MHLDEPLDEGRFVFECILAGNLQAFTMCSWLFQDVHSGLYSAFAWINLFLEIFCFLIRNKLFIPSNLYWTASFLVLRWVGVTHN